jgi:toxin ParE1/3/4
MPAVEWSTRALRSLDHIGDYIARDSPEQGRSFVQAIFRKVDDLAQFPFLGRPSAKSDIRELVIEKHYLVSYRIRPDRVEVLQVWHTAQSRNEDH